MISKDDPEPSGAESIFDRLAMPGIEHVDFDPPHLRFLVEPAALAEALSPEQDRPSLQGRLKKLSEKAQAEAGDNKQAVSEDERDDMWRR